MRDQEIISLWEAYQQVYTEGGFPGTPATPRAGDAGTSGLKMIQTPGGGTGYINKHSGGNVLPTGTVDKIMGGNLMVRKQPPKPTTQVAHFDLFDVIKGYLLDEGYADTEEAALAIMANMSKEWRQSVINEASLSVTQEKIARLKAENELTNLQRQRNQQFAQSALTPGPTPGAMSLARHREQQAEYGHSDAGLTKAQSKQILAQMRRSLETAAGVKPGSTEKDAWYNDPNYGKFGNLDGKGKFFSPRTVLAKQGGKEGKLTVDPNTGKKTFTAGAFTDAEKARYTSKGGK